MHYLKKIAPLMLSLMLFLLFIGCSKEIQIDGVAFRTNSKGEVATYKGMKIFFVTGELKNHAEQELVQWRFNETNRRSNEFNEDLAAFEEDRDRYNSTPSEQRNPSERENLERTLNGLKFRQSGIDTSGEFPHRDNEFMELIESSHTVITDLKGEFSVKLIQGQTYLIIAKDRPVGNGWFFEYTAQPQKLVLTKSNSIYSDSGK